MTDIEKVIKGLMCMGITRRPTDDDCKACGYYEGPNDCGAEVSREAINLLQEQDNKIDTLNTVIFGYENGYLKQKSAKPYRDICMIGVWRCGNCNSVIHNDYLFCPNCGRGIGWICEEFIHKKAMWEESEDETQESIDGDHAGADGVCAVVVRAAGG